MPISPTPRIALIHALEDSVVPARAAFAEGWPEAFCFDLLDTSLAIDRAEAGELDDSMKKRFATLATYAAESMGKGGRTAGILFTCSAFGPAIDAVKQIVTVPVLRPNEAAFASALTTGADFLLIVSFEPSREALETEFRAMAAAAGKSISVKTVLAEGALAALQSGDTERHDRLLCETAVQNAGSADTIILGQFSQARARPLVAENLPGRTVLSTPHSAAEALRKLVSNVS